MNNAIQEILARRMKEQATAEQQRQREFDNSLRVRQQDQQERYQREQLDGLKEQREAQAAVRRTTAGNRVAENLQIGDVLQPDQSDLLRDLNLVDRQAATLPSTQYTGFQSPPSAAGGFLRTGPTAETPPAGGVIRTNLTGNPERDVFRGTREQRAMQTLLESLPANSPQRRIVEYEAATGRNAPAAFQPPPPKDPTPRYSALQTYGPDGTPGDVMRFNSVTGEAAPLNVGGAIRPGAGRSTVKGLPARVQGFLLDLRGRHQSYDEALRELQRTFANAPDETFDRLDAATKLRQLYAQPSGLSDFEQQFGSFGGPSILGGGTPQTPPPRSAPSGGRSVTRAELRAVAQQLGISEADAASQARARSLAVVD